MILHYVTDGADLLVESTSALNAEILGHRNLHAFYVGPVPEGFEDGIGKAEEQHAMHGLLAEVMVDPVNGLLVKRFEKDLIESPGGGQITTEWFFDDDAAAAGAIGL